jgi:hypothetical protein
MAITFSNRVEGANAIRALEPGTLIASFTDGRDHAGHFRPAEAPTEGTAAAEVFPAVIRVTAVSGRDADGPARLILSTGTAIALHPNAAVVTVSGTF